MNIGTACCGRADCADEHCQGRMNRDHAVDPPRPLSADDMGYEAALPTVLLIPKLTPTRVIDWPLVCLYCTVVTAFTTCLLLSIH